LTAATRPDAVGSAALGADCAAIYAEHAGFVWRVLRGMAIGRPQIEDAVQDVFIVVHRRYAEFDHRSKVQTWLFEICYRVAHAHRRQHKALQALTISDDELPARTPSPAEQLEKHERARLLFGLLDKLPEDKRMVLLLVEIEGMTAPEVAEALKLPLNTVYSRLRRARSEFSAAFEADRRRQR
jgi:RNA polymerase sigma-70 factor (ECF subfamily)